MYVTSLKLNCIILSETIGRKMITETKEVYKCEYCRKLYQRKGYCVTHELRCNKNPVNFRPCFSCEHLENRTINIQIDSNGYESLKEVKALYCKFYNKNLLPPIGVHRGDCYEFGDELTEAMPLKCEEFDTDRIVDFKASFKRIFGREK